MFKTSKNKDKTPVLKLANKIEPLEPHKHPMICLFDFNGEVEEELAKLRFNCVAGSFGANVKVNNRWREEKLLKLNLECPSNLHEFDILMLDMTNNTTEIYDPSQHSLENTTGAKAHALLSQYPEQVFDPRPLSVHIIAKEINELISKKSIVIAFCGSENIAEYHLVEVTSRGKHVTETHSCSNFTFYKGFPQHQDRHGKKAVIPEGDSKLSPLFEKHLNGIEYSTIFFHPTEWKDNKNSKIENFIPLLLNDRNEILSYAHFVHESLVLVFPNIKEKTSFVSDLFKTYLPDIMPDIFPFHGEFGWLENGEYLLPGESELLLQRKEIEEKYLKDIERNKESIAEVKEQYRFLADLISESGHKLVCAVEHYLKWLGFESVVNLDDTNPETLEEDLQVDCGDRFLVIEIKGIGGTSTDKDCSQISKIRYRRAEQRGKFDVFGLYVVNHQRYIPPKSRVSPPFTENQIKDANLDKRGLLTTYDLYKAYFLIEEGILKKNFVKDELFKTGLVSLEPSNLRSLGIPDEYFMAGQIAIVNLDGVSIKKGDTLIVKKQDEYFKATIESLELDDAEVKSADSGVVGVKFDKKLKRNSELFVEIE